MQGRWNIPPSAATIGQQHAGAREGAKLDQPCLSRPNHTLHLHPHSTSTIHQLHAIPEMPPARRSARTAAAARDQAPAHPYTRANRPPSPKGSASIARPANGKTSLRLTVKAAPSKLRQATSGSRSAASIPPNSYADNASESDATPIPVARSARSTRNPRTVVEPESEEEEDEDDEDEVDEEEDIEVDDEEQELEDAEEDSMEDAEGEEDEDEDMEDAEGEEDEHPPPPVIKTTNPLGRSNPNVTVTAPQDGPLKSVEDKEMEDEEEELSELDSNENENEEEEDDEDDSDSDEDDESRGATPDLSKLTRRQRGFFTNIDDDPEGKLMELSNEALKKKVLTAEEHAMRRAEMARRRKNLSEKRNEEEKVSLPPLSTSSILSLLSRLNRWTQ
jgi:Ino eighty subunit 2